MLLAKLKLTTLWNVLLPSPVRDILRSLTVRVAQLVGLGSHWNLFSGHVNKLALATDVSAEAARRVINAMARIRVG
jgi:hypothetical protein